MRRGDVYWVEFDPSRGGEIQKRRPAVIVSINAANRVQNRVHVIPLTSNVGTTVHRWQALVQVGDTPSKALADQIRTVAKERLTAKLGSIAPREMLAVEQALRVQLDLR
jgi:mRNA interferase MazF